MHKMATGVKVVDLGAEMQKNWLVLRLQKYSGIVASTRLWVVVGGHLPHCLRGWSQCLGL